MIDSGCEELVTNSCDGGAATSVEVRRAAPAQSSPSSIPHAKRVAIDHEQTFAFLRNHVLN